MEKISMNKSSKSKNRTFSDVFYTLPKTLIIKNIFSSDISSQLVLYILLLQSKQGFFFNSIKRDSSEDHLRITSVAVNVLHKLNGLNFIRQLSWDDQTQLDFSNVSINKVMLCPSIGPI